MRKTLSWFILSFFIVVPNEAWAGKIYFHWGDINGNGTLLHLGGYDFGGLSHFQRLSSGSAAQINDQVIRQAYQWYIASGSMDVGGGGFYASADVFDSRSFGNDLLIVEVDDTGKSFKISGDSDIKKLSDEAYKVGQLDTVPLMTSYSHNGTWHVISRSPNRGETGITFRPPSEGDVEKVWAQFSSQQGSGIPIKTKTAGQRAEDGLAGLKIPLAFLQKISQALNRRSSQVPITRSSEILFHRLLFDRGYKFLNANIIGHIDISASSALMEDLTQIVSAFNKIIPADQRTKEITDYWVKQYMHSSSVDIFGLMQAASSHARESQEDVKDPSLKLVAEIYPVLDDNQRQELGRFVLGVLGLKSEFVFSNFTAFVTILQNYHRSVDNDLTQAVIKRMKKIISTKHFSMKEIHGVFKFVGLFMGSDASAFEIARQKLLAAIDTFHPTSGKGGLYEQRVDFGKYFMRVLEELHHFGPEGAGSLLKEALIAYAIKGDAYEKAKLERQRLRNGYHSDYLDKDGESFNRARAVQVALDFIYSDNLDATLRSSLMQGMKQALASNVGGRPLSEALFGFHVFRHGDVQKSAEIARKTAGDFPELIPRMLSFIEFDIQYTTSGDQDSHFVITALARDLRAMQLQAEKRDKTAHLRTRFEGLAASDSYPLSKIDVEKYLREEVIAVHNKVPGSEYYSNLAKIFVLVDPLLVSEDLRVMHARHPELRFNEDYSHNGKTFSQPVWQNFEEGWEYLSLVNWHKHAMELGRNKLDQVKNILLMGKVEGSSLNQPSLKINNWDRQKYRTEFTAAEWALFEGEKHRAELSRFFDITDGPDGTILQFKSERELGEFIPHKGSAYDTTETKLQKYIESQVYAVNEPIKRAARILHLTTKLHPAENGNGRFARTWAAMELAQAGLPIPIGLPTNDFVMTEERLVWEVRKAVALGRMWENMLKTAAADRIDPEKFFQEVFKGSALEGLMHVSPTHIDEFMAYVHYLESLQAPPQWAKAFAAEVENEIVKLRNRYGSVSQAAEGIRSLAIEMVWRKFRRRAAGNLPMELAHPAGASDGAQSDCGTTILLQ